MKTMIHMAQNYKISPENSMFHVCFYSTLNHSSRLLDNIIYRLNTKKADQCQITEVVEVLNGTLKSFDLLLKNPLDSHHKIDLFNHTEKLRKTADFDYTFNRNYHIIRYGLLLMAESLTAMLFLSIMITAAPVMSIAASALTVALCLAAMAKTASIMVKGIAVPREKILTKNIADSLSTQCGEIKIGFFGKKTLITPPLTAKPENERARSRFDV